MNERIKNLRDFIFNKEHHKFRRTVEWNLAEKFAAEKTAPALRAATALSELLKAETPVFIPQSRIAFVRTVTNMPERYTKAESQDALGRYSYSERGVPFNFTPDFMSVISIGLGAFRKKIADRMASADEDGKTFLQGALISVDAVTDLIKRYIAEAEKQGMTECAANLKAVLSDAPQTFEQALQLFRILHYTLWCEGAYHMGVGRLDVMLYPYYKKDIESGIISEDEAFELLEEFFLTFNIDSDFYIGVQQGDNGQSLMVGGCDADGNDVWNDLSEKILLASCELKLIDPKINFRVNSKTPIERIALGSKLTRAGLGFPQYSNDDVVIPALVKWGYSLEDARNYSCAACWEFLIPGVAHELVNLDAVSMPEILLDTMQKSKAETFDAFCTEIEAELRTKAVSLLKKYENLNYHVLPFTSVINPISIEKAQNITQAGKYHNWGMHCSGIAVAADSLSAVEKIVFEDKNFSMAEFCKILGENFENSPDLLKNVRENAPKLGTANSGKAVKNLSFLTDAWAKAWDGLKNIQGGIVRPGTGSAMYYIWHSENLSATPDGRLKGEPFSANYAPSLDIPLAGPLTVIRDFAAPDMSKVCNGGPLTIELHDSVFTADDAEMKVAAMIAEFIRRGGHQLQLNTLNSEVLRDAQKHPERYANLIVRVWGWSGKFVELDKVYQDHIIRRSAMSFA